MARLVRAARPAAVRLISYQDTAAHTGTIYKAAGWRAAGRKGSQTRWDMPGRKRRPPQSAAPKVRWERPL
jgi:hypothetical protein